MLKQESGILLLALGYPYYGRMAYNLAMSIKATDPNAHITLVYSGSGIAHINQRNMWVFDNKMQIEDDGRPFGAKLRLNEFTPYERTLYIDTDTLWVGKIKPTVLIDQLKGIQFTGITEGFHDFDNPNQSDPSKNYFFWADVADIETKYNCIGKLYQWRSEFIYFEQNKITDQFFGIAQGVYTANTTGRPFGNHEPLKGVKKFASHIPDELALNIAANICGITPHEYKWQPSYWDALHGGYMPNIDVLSASYYIISCGGNANFGALKRVYDRVTGASAYKLKLQHVFPLISKKEMLTTRQLM